MTATIILFVLALIFFILSAASIMFIGESEYIDGPEVSGFVFCAVVFLLLGVMSIFMC